MSFQNTIPSTPQRSLDTSSMDDIPLTPMIMSPMSPLSPLSPLLPLSPMLSPEMNTVLIVTPAFGYHQSRIDNGFVPETPNKEAEDQQDDQQDDQPELPNVARRLEFQE